MRTDLSLSVYVEMVLYYYFDHFERETEGIRLQGNCGAKFSANQEALLPNIMKNSKDDQWKLEILHIGISTI